MSRVASQSYVSYAVLDDLYQSLVVAVVLSRLDNADATLAGLPTSLLNRLQSVINAAARSIAGLRRSEHITDALASRQFPLAPSARAHQVQTGRYRLPSTVLFTALHLGTYRNSFSTARHGLSRLSGPDIRPEQTARTSGEHFFAPGRPGLTGLEYCNFIFI